MMNNRKYHTDPQILLEQGQALVKGTKDARYRHKIEVVNLVLGGMTAQKVSEFVKESKNTVSRWVKITDERGWDALKDLPHGGGRQTKLTENEVGQIDIALQNDPQDYGYAVWDGPALSDFIGKHFGIELSVSSCQRLFHTLGYSLRRPQTYPIKGEENTVLREEFKKRSMR